MIIINKNDISDRLFAPNVYFFIIFSYFYPLIFYKKGGPEQGRNCPIFPLLAPKRKALVQPFDNQRIAKA